MRSIFLSENFFLDYCQRIYGEYFKGPQVDLTNIWYGGTSIADVRIIFVNG